MYEFPLAGKYGQRYSKVVVLPVGQGNETLFDDLGYVQHSWEADRILFSILSLIQQANWTDHQILVGLPQALQESDVVRMVLQVGWEHLREQLLYQLLPLGWSYLAKTLDQKLREFGDWELKESPDLEGVVLGSLDKQLDQV